MELNERKLKILQAVVDDYIASGMPIGSRTISRMWEDRKSTRLNSSHSRASRMPSSA